MSWLPVLESFFIITHKPSPAENVLLELISVFIENCFAADEIVAGASDVPIKVKLELVPSFAGTPLYT